MTVFPEIVLHLNHLSMYVYIVPVEAPYIDIHPSPNILHRHKCRKLGMSFAYFAHFPHQMAWPGETPIAGCWAGRAANGRLACSPTLLGARVCYTLDQSPPRGKVTLMKKAGINTGARSKTTEG